MEVLIRPFRPADWDGVFLLDQACFVPPYRLEYPRLRALVEDPTVAVLVIEAREEIPVQPPVAPAIEASESEPVTAKSEPEASEAAPSQAATPKGAASPPTDPTPVSNEPAEAKAEAKAETKPTVNTAIVGGLLLKWDAEGARLVILSVMVEPGFRRVGLGRRLIGWAERIAQARRLPELLAPLEAENGNGTAFLGALGFSRQPGAPPFFDDPVGGDLWRRGVVLPPDAPPQPEATRPAESVAGPAASVPKESP